MNSSLYVASVASMPEDFKLPSLQIHKFGILSLKRKYRLKFIDSSRGGRESMGRYRMFSFLGAKDIKIVAC